MNDDWLVRDNRVEEEGTTEGRKRAKNALNPFCDGSKCIQLGAPGGRKLQWTSAPKRLNVTRRVEDVAEARAPFDSGSARPRQKVTVNR